MNSQPDLKALFDQFNKDYFDGIIPDIPIEWNTRLRVTGGRCWYAITRQNGYRLYSASRIDMNYRLFEKNGWNMEEVERTLIHEMVHAWQVTKRRTKCGHDREFQSKMDQIFGYKRSHRCHNYDTQGLKEERKVEAHCPIHGVVYRYARMPRNRKRCRKCGSIIEMVDTRNQGGIKIKINL